MEGSVHTEAPHKEVVSVSEENYKIQYFELQETMIIETEADVAAVPTGGEYQS